jgi:tetratricopeptide (TPR) repeat protein
VSTQRDTLPVLKRWFSKVQSTLELPVVGATKLGGANEYNKLPVLILALDSAINKRLSMRHAVEDYQELLTTCDLVMEDWPTESELQSRKALLYWLAGNINQARTTAQGLLSAQPEQWIAHWVLANIAQREQHHKQLVHSLYILRHHPQRKFYAKRHPWMAHQVRELQAEYLAQQAHSDRVTGLHRLSYSWQARLAQMGLSFFTAWQCATQPETLGHAFTVAWAHLVGRWQPLGLRVKSLQSLLASYPGSAVLTTELGRCYFLANNPDMAILTLKRATVIDPHYENAWIALGQQYERSHLPGKCLTIYERLIQLYPSRAEYHCQVGNFLVDLKQYALAYEAYQCALMLGEDNQWKALLANSLAQISALHLRNAEAVKAWHHLAIQLNPQQKESYSVLGATCFDNDENRAARVACELARRHNPNDAQTAANLGYLYWAEGRTLDAVAHYEEAIRLNPLYEVAWNNLGVILLDSTQQIHRAIHCLESAIALKDDYLLAFFNLGRAYSRLGRTREAATAILRAKQLNALTREMNDEDLDALFEELFSATHEFSAEITPKITELSSTHPNGLSIEIAPQDDPPKKNLPSANSFGGLGLLPPPGDTSSLKRPPFPTEPNASDE